MGEKLQTLDIKKKDLIAIRPGAPEDKNLIYTSWLKGLRFGNNWFELIDKDAYYENYQKVLDRVFSKPTIKIIIACLKDDPEIILGYSVSEPGILHWVYVKTLWRKLGIAKDLIPQDITTVTHITKIGAAIKPARIVFDPFLL